MSSSVSDRIRIAIDINVLPGECGGTVQSTMGLVRSLGQLDGAEQYLLVTPAAAQTDWISQYSGPNQRIVSKPKAGQNGLGHHNGNGHGSALKHMLRPAVRATRRVMGRLFPPPPVEWPVVPLSDGFYENLGCDVLHFPTQAFVLCALPTIYNPHDLLHMHYPQFFTAQELAWRETIYPTACHFSHTVVVGSEWIKQDVIRKYGTSPDKLQIIPWAPPTHVYPQVSAEQLDAARVKYQLPQTFMFYPAVTWPHKNHLRLFEAMAMLRDDRGLVVNLVCTGARHEPFWPRIQQALRELKLESQVKFLGFLPEGDLRAVYRLSQFLVLPTLFEADSCPIHEAWTEGIPVASANITALPDQVGEAGLLFDPKDIAAIADVVQKMTTDAALREELRGRGYQRVKDFSWERTAKAFRAVYRRAAGCTLNEEDRWLLSWDWMREPRRQPEYIKA